MNTEQLRMCEPLFGHWQVSDDGFLGEGSFGSVFRIQREEFGSLQYAALKVIEVPKSLQETKKLEDMGMTEQEMRAYCNGIVSEIYQEVKLMQRLKGKTNILHYEDHEIRQQQNGVGYQIFIRMELATTIAEYTRGRQLELQEVLQLGSDLCKALICCQKHNILHRDIKPDNIFISEDGDFMLGDFGIARIVDDYQIGLSNKGSYNFIAPEIYYSKPYDHRADLYSLGIVLYSYLNHKKIPFLHQKKQVNTYSEQKEALKKRLEGNVPELPKEVPECVQAVIKKAIAFEPEDRYGDATEMLQALEIVRKEIAEQEKSSLLQKTVELSMEPFVCRKEPCKRRKRKKKTGVYSLGAIAIGLLLVSPVLEDSLEQTRGDHSVQVDQGVQAKVVKETNAARTQPATVTARVEVTTKASLVAETPKMTMKPTNVPVKKTKTKKKRASEKNVRKETVSKKVETPVPTEAVVYARSLVLPSAMQMCVGGSVLLPIDIAPSHARYCVSVSNTAVLDCKGTTITAKKVGECKVIVTSGTKKAICKVQVTKE